MFGPSTVKVPSSAAFFFFFLHRRDVLFIHLSFLIYFFIKGMVRGGSRLVMKVQGREGEKEGPYIKECRCMV